MTNKDTSFCLHRTRHLYQLSSTDQLQYMGDLKYKNRHKGSRQNKITYILQSGWIFVFWRNPKPKLQIQIQSWCLYFLVAQSVVFSSTTNGSRKVDVKSSNSKLNLQERIALTDMSFQMYYLGKLCFFNNS